MFVVDQRFVLGGGLAVLWSALIAIVVLIVGLDGVAFALGVGRGGRTGDKFLWHADDASGTARISWRGRGRARARGPVDGSLHKWEANR